jgi:adenosylcobyric acid synthase
VKGALLVAGTNSDAGKSVLTAGLCRWLARQGVRVAPFKAQNMSLNSFVTAGGAEIGRAQVMQAAAAGVEPTADMNPVLLKPGSDRRSQVVVLGQPVAEADAMSYRPMAAQLREVALASLNRLRAQYDVVICEGAGSPAEINLRATDVANMGLATAAELPVIVVGDIDRGGVFAALYGTLALMPPADQQLVAGFVINKFRGAPELLASGNVMLEQLTGRPLLGVLPWTEGLGLDAEDSLALSGHATKNSAAPPTPHTSPTPRTSPGPHTSPDPRTTSAPRTTPAPPASAILRVSVVRFPRISNFTDLDALGAEPGLLIRFATEPAELADADLVILPGTRATVADLDWLRQRGLAAAITERAVTGRPVLGICGGYQMLARDIDDRVESKAGQVTGLGLLPGRVVFADRKTLGRPQGEALGAPVTGYEIHHGRVALDLSSCEPFLDGGRAGAVWGTSWHGTLENDAFRRAFLAAVARQAGRPFVPAPDTDFARLREARLDALGDLVERHLDTAALGRLISGGAPPGLLTLPPPGVSNQ